MNNQNIISWFICLIFMLLLSGCGWKQRDLSEDEPFSSYIGTNFTLKVQMTLREREKHQYGIVPHAIMTEGTAESLGRIVCTLPVGTKLKVKAVKTVEIHEGPPIYILGVVKNSTTEEWVDFEILLGRWDKKIWVKRMPWESDSVPENRYLPH